jgi:Flp pilus assembly protein TadB
MALTALAMAAAGIAAWLIVDGPRASAPRRSRRLSQTAAVRLAAICAGLMVAITWANWMGVVLALLIAAALPSLFRHLESRADRQRRQLLERQIPACCELLAACLAAGASPIEAVRAVTAALDDPLAGQLRRLVSAHDLGADSLTAWSQLGDEPSLMPIARAAARSAETGAPLSGLLTALAQDQRDIGRARAEAAARAAGVRSVAPLAACFLPAFLLIGIVPVVASLVLPML